MVFWKPDKTLTWISINSQLLFHLNQSQPYAVLTTFADITERKQAECSRHRAEQEKINYDRWVNTSSKPPLF